jgi:hypothetical protein
MFETCRFRPIRQLLAIGCVYLAAFATQAETPIDGAREAARSEGAMIMPLSLADSDAGFTSIYDGKTLEGWDGDPARWHVEQGNMVGETSPDYDQPEGTFLIWRGVLKNFELKLEYRVSRAGKSGVFYRAIEPHYRKWLLGGYQFAIDGPDWSRSIAAYLEAKLGRKISAGDLHGSMPRLTGQNFEEVWSETPPQGSRQWGGMPPGRQFLSMPGQMTYIPEGQIQRVVGNLMAGSRIDDLATDDWNKLHLIARENVMIHILNGHVVSIVIDDDLKQRRLDGKLGLQLHPGPPMKVEFRHIRLKAIETNQ